MSTTYGMSFIFEQEGNSQDCTFTDINNRMSFRIRCTLRNAEQTAYMIYDGNAPIGRGGTTVPVACLNFGVNHALGTVKIGQREFIKMDEYLARVSRNDSTSRKFTAADGNSYVWARKANSQGELEWECVSAANSGYLVASYIPKSTGTGAGFVVEEAYAQLAGEFLTSFTIMRLIVEYNL
ncbi:hypothetical protein NM688_g3154 [Phlebia brevispora]|uniref:Uncharacterized protein n=1 Tax=Phlebia brevispora TaxID=194682 RepID=A0ACC1T793_9APHY|nr:hypothetical protein NM688_g3154 [Phlebia brevispora]